MASASAVPSRSAVLGSTDLVSRCIEFVPDCLVPATLVSRAFRTTTEAMLERSLAFVRDHGERVLKSIVICESAKAKWEAEYDHFYVGGEFAFERFTVYRELPKDARAAFEFAWIAAPGQAMTEVIQWEKVARHRWLSLFGDDYKKFWQDDAHAVASFERAYRYFAASPQFDSDDLNDFSVAFIDMMFDWWHKQSIEDDDFEMLYNGVERHVMKRWSDPRLKVSFLFGPVVAYCVNEFCWEHYSKSDCDAHMRRLCNDLDGDMGGYTSEKAASFRAAYAKMMSTVTVYDDDDDWDEEIALKFAFYAVLQEYL